MDPAVQATLMGGVGGTLIGWAMILISYKVGGKLGNRVATKRVISDRHLQPMFGNPISSWSRAWAWKPVHTLDHGYIWLRFYWRRRIHKKQFLHGGADFWWQNVKILHYLSN
jgi:hypothetical protein